MQKLLIVLFTHNKYSHLVQTIWARLLELNIPTEITNVDILIFTENTENEIVEICKDNKFLYEIIQADMSGLKEYLTDPQWVNEAGWTFEQMYRVVQLRNQYLEYALENSYDWMLQVDGDIIPPKDGLIKLFKAEKS